MKSWIGEGNVWENYLFKEALCSQWIRECLWTSQMVMANNIVGHRQFLWQSYEGKVDNNNKKLQEILNQHLCLSFCDDYQIFNVMIPKILIFYLKNWTYIYIYVAFAGSNKRMKHIKRMCRVKEVREIHKENNVLIFFCENLSNFFY